jgi:hypothetical protein
LDQLTSKVEILNNVEFSEGITCFMLINPKSGLQAGKTILEGGVNTMTFDKLGKVSLANILNIEQMEIIFERIKEFQGKKLHHSRHFD